MKRLLKVFAAHLRPVRIEWPLMSSAIVLFALFAAGNPVFAAGDHKIQCTPHTAVSKSMIVASLTTVLPPAERSSPVENFMVKDTVAPRSQWIRVAPLVNTYGGKCCCNSDCSSKSKSCC